MQMKSIKFKIIHKSKFLPGTVEKNSSTIRSSRHYNPSEKLFTSSEVPQNHNNKIQIDFMQYEDDPVIFLNWSGNNNGNAL